MDAQNGGFESTAVAALKNQTALPGGSPFPLANAASLLEWGHLFPWDVWTSLESSAHKEDTQHPGKGVRAVGQEGEESHWFSKAL